MKFPLFTQAALTRDVPEDGLKTGDLVTVVDYHPVPDGEDGYSIEVFNAVGSTLVVTVVPESALGPLREDHVLSVRPLAKTD